ncbi:MAG: isoprenyl transferase [Flavobacteriales bacterium]|nr:isoprenyl transferase [Flavobacteriales bacterium]
MAIDPRIDTLRLPQHVAVIMDGNGRWAKQRGKLRTFGHTNGVKAVRETVETAAEIGIPFLTLYAFSTENWNRPKMEVSALMTLLVRTIHKETKTLMDNNIRLNAIGDLDSLPKSCHRELNEAMERTSGNTRMTLTLALSYSAKWELVQMVRSIVKDARAGALNERDVNEALIAQRLCTAGMPDVELLIRTSGEHRVSNFLLWQIAYAEFHFTEKLWPDFGAADLEQAIIDFQGRERRFGKISEQVREVV